MRKAKVIGLILFSSLFMLFTSKNIFASSSLINKEYKSINVYEKFDIKTIQNDSSKKYNYSSSDNAVASVNSDGIVIGEKMGECYITVSDDSGNSSKLNIRVGFYKGIDVSTFNGDVNYSSIKSQGIDFVMIRSSYGWYDSYDAAAGKEYGFQYDAKLYNNVKGAVENNVPFGIYHYSYARNTSEAALEAEYTINALKSTGAYANSMSLPIAYDVEDSKYQGSIDKETLTDIVITYCTKIREAGYQPMIYANKSWFVEHLNINRLNSLGYDFWYALWPGGNIDFSNKIQIADSGIYPLIWQYTSSGSVDGANSNSGRVDLNVMYMKEQVKLTFVSDGQVVEEKGIDKNSSLSEIPKASKNGYTFQKWIDQNGNEITLNTKFSTNMELCAVFKKRTIKLSKARVFLIKENQEKITTMFDNGDNISPKDLIYKSLDETIAIIDENGTITGKNIGTTKIQVSLKDDQTITCICDVEIGDNYKNGDVNKDGIVDVSDVIYAMNKLSKGTLTDEEKNIGNVNYDNIFDVADIIKIMRYLSGKVASLS